MDEFWTTVEYDRGAVPIAIVEYKKGVEQSPPDYNSSQMTALRRLANNSSIPLFLALYEDEPHWWFKILAFNAFAEAEIGREPRIMSELEWSEFLHRLRGMNLSPALRETLHTYKPERK